MYKFIKSQSSEKTRNFYGKLSRGEAKLGVWGKEQRFDPIAIPKKQSVLRHFLPRVNEYLFPNDRCLDLGCGPGGFLTLIAPLCSSVVGADIVPDFIIECRDTIEKHGIDNASAVLLDSPRLPFSDREFDKVIMVDTIHHLENPTSTLIEVHRVLKTGGILIIFEPNKYNPLLALLCALDKNEHGLLKLGTFQAYRHLLGREFQPICEVFNGTLVGPEGKLAVAIADFVSDPQHSLLRWLSPKLFMVFKKL